MRLFLKKLKKKKKKKKNLDRQDPKEINHVIANEN